jgi:hypothetical protein
MSVERFLPERCGTPCYKCKKKVDAYGKKTSDYETVFYCGICGSKVFTVTIAQPTDTEETLPQLELTDLKTALTDYKNSVEYTNWIVNEVKESVPE